MWLSSIMKSVIVGGSGWVAKTATAHFFKKDFKRIDDVIIYGSKERLSDHFGEFQYPIKKWQVKRESFEVETFVPAAFLTLTQNSKYDEHFFNSYNLELIEKACQYIEQNSPKKCILFSSGITTLPEEMFSESLQKLSYRKLKILEEIKVKDICDKVGSRLIVCRLFSASGKFIKDPDHYALSNFILQGLTHRRIVVSSQYAVWRRYADLGQIFELSANLADTHDFFVFESGGVLMELHDLSARVASLLGLEVPEQHLDQNHHDSYFSKSSLFEELAQSMDLKLLSIDDQISETRKGVEDFISRQKQY